MTGKIWTVSNALSMLRVVLLPPVVYLILHPSPENNLWAGAIVFVAGLTDLFDGMLARMLNQVTDVGKIIDPLADKICVGVVATLLVIQGRLPVWFIVLALTRDLVIFVCGIYVQRTRGIIVMSNMPGKWAVTFIAFLILALVLGVQGPVVMVLLAASTVMLIVSSVLYAIRFFAILNTSAAPQ